MMVLLLMLDSDIPVKPKNFLIDFLFFNFCFLSAADWKLDEPAWSGRMKITAKGKMAFIKLEDKNTGKSPVALLFEYGHRGTKA